MHVCVFVFWTMWNEMIIHFTRPGYPLSIGLGHFTPPTEIAII